WQSSRCNTKFLYLKIYLFIMTQTVKTNYPALYTLIVVFFFWGFLAAGNNIFIPFCKDYFQLDQFQSQLIDFAFYTAYYVGALILFAISNVKGKDLVTHWGRSEEHTSELQSRENLVCRL